MNLNIKIYAIWKHFVQFLYNSDFDGSKNIKNFSIE